MTKPMMRTRTYVETNRRPWSSRSLVVYVYVDSSGEERLAGPAGSGTIVDGSPQTRAADAAWTGSGRTVLADGWRWMTDDEGEYVAIAA